MASGAVRTATKSVDSMDATKRSRRRVRQSAWDPCRRRRAERRGPASRAMPDAGRSRHQSTPSPRSWPCSPPPLCFYGPAPRPGRRPICSSRRARCSPSSACCGSSPTWRPCQLPFRGNTYAFVLEEVPLLLGLVFLAPNLLVLSAVVRRRLHLRRPAPAGADEDGIQRGLGRLRDGARRHRLPRAPGVAQPGQPPGLGRGGGRARDRSDAIGHHCCGSSRCSTARPGEAADRHHPDGDQGDAHGGEPLPRLRLPRRRLAQPLDDPAPRGRGGPDHRGLPGLRATPHPLLVPAAPLRLQPDHEHGQPRAVVHERGRPEGGLHGHAGPPGRAHPGRAVGDPPPDLVRRAAEPSGIEPITLDRRRPS